MKKILIMALAVISLFSCKEDEVVTNTDDGRSVALIKINVQGSNFQGRAVEDGHSGTTGQEVTPDIKTINVLAYNESGTLISNISVDDMVNALKGKYTINGTSNAETSDGAKVGLPKGTKYVSVILNQYDNADGITNINFFNYRDGKDKDGKDYANGATTFARVPLTPTNGQRVLLSDANQTPGSGKDGKIPEYNVSFTVAPSLARFEVYGGINVKPTEIWKNYFGNTWIKVKASEFLTLMNTMGTDSNIETIDELKDAISSTGAINLVVDENTYYGAMIEGDKNDVDDNTAVYLPKYFWAYSKDASSKVNPEVISTNIIDNARNVAADVTELTATGKWILDEIYKAKNPQDKDLVTWNPNIYYAIDVEEIFINNIKVLSNNASVFMHQWPGSQKDEYWPNWYNAFHIHGWHTAGKSASNTFLCMGNMWDRIALADNTNSEDLVMTAVPDVTDAANHLTMPVITGKAKVLAGASVYYDVANSRNLGVISGKAAAYQIYPQTTSIANTVANKDNLGSVLPHIIIKLKAYATEQDYKDGKAVDKKDFITIKLFSAVDAGGAVGNYVTDYQMSNIYRLNLNDIVKALRPQAPVPNGVNLNPEKPGEKPEDPNNPIDPDPEMPGVSLVMKVTVLPWTIQNITPEI